MVYFHLVVRFLTAQKYNQTFGTWGLRGLRDDHCVLKSRWVGLLCSVFPQPSSVSQRLFVFSSLAHFLCLKICCLLHWGLLYVYVRSLMETCILVRNKNKTVKGSERIVNLKEHLAEGSFMDGFPDLFFYHLHCTSSALYHTVLMLISLFLHANILFCLSKWNKNCNTRLEAFSSFSKYLLLQVFLFCPVSLAHLICQIFILYEIC